MMSTSSFTTPFVFFSFLRLSIRTDPISFSPALPSPPPPSSSSQWFLFLRRFYAFFLSVAIRRTDRLPVYFLDPPSRSFCGLRPRFIEASSPFRRYRLLQVWAFFSDALFLRSTSAMFFGTGHFATPESYCLCFLPWLGPVIFLPPPFSCESFDPAAFSYGPICFITLAPFSLLGVSLSWTFPQLLLLF